jgi:hypothetical protein
MKVIYRQREYDYLADGIGPRKGWIFVHWSLCDGYQPASRWAWLPAHDCQPID